MNIFTTPRFGVGDVPVDRPVQKPLSCSGRGWGQLREPQLGFHMPTMVHQHHPHPSALAALGLGSCCPYITGGERM